MKPTSIVVSLLDTSSELLRCHVRALEAAGYEFHRANKRGDLYFTDADIELLRSVYELRKESHLSVIEAAFASQQKPVPIELQPTYISNAKPRENRKRTHNDEWLEDLIALLNAEEGILQGSLADIAKRVGCAVSTLQEVLKKGVTTGLFDVQSARGRNGKTTIVGVQKSKSN